MSGTYPVPVPDPCPSPRRRPAWLVAVLLVVSGVALAGCGSGSDGDPTSATGDVRGVTVTGAVGAVPDVRIKAPLHVPRTVVETLVSGDGPPVQADQLFVLQLTMYDARTGDKAISTHDSGQTALAVRTSDDTLFPVLSRALVGVHQGSRLLVVATGEDTFGDAGAPQYHVGAGDPVVLVADVVAVPPADVLALANGTPVTPPRSAPRVETASGTPTRIDFTRPDGRPLPRPKRLVVVPLLEGTGPAAKADGLVTIDYLGQVWGSASRFEDTYAKEPTTVPLGVGQVVPGWEHVLVGAHRGSRYLVVVPPSLGFGAAGSPPAIPGNATLAYVIDVLGVS